jgi:transcriptional regulator with XRE-family HTH domain
VTQAVAARKLGLTPPRMNDLLRGRINKFSLDTLMNLATRAGLAVRVGKSCARRREFRLRQIGETEDAGRDADGVSLSPPGGER